MSPRKRKLKPIDEATPEEAVALVTALMPGGRMPEMANGQTPQTSEELLLMATTPLPARSDPMPTESSRSKEQETLLIGFDELALLMKERPNARLTIGNVTVEPMSPEREAESKAFRERVRASRKASEAKNP